MRRAKSQKEEVGLEEEGDGRRGGRGGEFTLPFAGAASPFNHPLGASSFLPQEARYGCYYYLVLRLAILICSIVYFAPSTPMEVEEGDCPLLPLPVDCACGSAVGHFGVIPISLRQSSDPALLNEPRC